MESLHEYSLEVEQEFKIFGIVNHLIIKDKDGNIVDDTVYDIRQVYNEEITPWNKPKVDKKAIAHNQAENKRIKEWLSSYGIHLEKEG
jgi:hypothetical protein